MTTLADFAVGERGTVAGVRGVDAVSIRLMEMGLTPGVSLEVIGTAPFGDPIELELRGYRLSVRKREAELVDMHRADDRCR